MCFWTVNTQGLFCCLEMWQDPVKSFDMSKEPIETKVLFQPFVKFKYNSEILYHSLAGTSVRGL